MKRIRKTHQGELFGTSPAEEMKRQVSELDALIARALKSSDYRQARSLTARQEKLIQKLVSMGEDGQIERE